MPLRIITSVFITSAVLSGMFSIVHFAVSFGAVERFSHAEMHSVGLPVECNIVSDVSHALESIRESVEKIKQFADSLSKFFETVWGVVSFIGSLFGAKALLLLLGVMVFSGLFATLGLPRGKLSFCISLGCADFIWIAWRNSFEGVDAGFIFDIIKVNLVLLTPFVIIQLSKRYYPVIAHACVRSFRRIKRKKRGIPIDAALSFLKRYKAVENAFESQLVADIAAATEGHVVISDETKRRLEAMNQSLADFFAQSSAPKNNT
jgi:rRNA-processing protein FCF1